MRKLILLALIFASCGGGGSVEAAPDNHKKIYVRLIHIQDSRTFGVDDAVDNLQQAIDYFEARLDLEISISSVISIPDPHPEIDSVDRQYSLERQRSSAIRQFVINNDLYSRVNKREILYIIDKPLVRDGTYYAGGLSTQCSLYSPFAYSIAFTKSIDRPYLDAKKFSISVITHELGHALGADHVDENDNIMNYTVLGYWELFPNFNLSPISVEEINLCTNKRTRIILRQCLKTANPKRCKKRRFIRGVKKRHLKTI